MRVSVSGLNNKIVHWALLVNNDMGHQGISQPFPLGAFLDNHSELAGPINDFWLIHLSGWQWMKVIALVVNIDQKAATGTKKGTEAESGKNIKHQAQKMIWPTKDSGVSFGLSNSKNKTKHHFLLGFKV